MTINIFGIKFNIRKYELVVLIIITTVILGLIGYKIQQNNKGVIINVQDNKVPDASVDIDSPKTIEDSYEGEKSEQIQVYVVGCVHNPGVVTLKKGQIIEEAIDAAGGATEEADLENINLVYKLNRNVMLKIRSKKDKPPESGVDDNGGSGVIIIEDSGGAVKESTKKSNKVNLNTASLDELKTLPGVGEVTAKDIIIYREKYGEFKTIKDIMKVNGIKEGRFNSIKDYIKVN